MVELVEGEKLIKVVHRHWFVMAASFAIYFLLVVVPIAAYAFMAIGEFSIFPQFLREMLINKISWGAFAYSLWVAFLWILFFMEWTNYYLDVWIITDQRVVSINQRGFFNREIITVRYNQIQDVTSIVRGIIPSFLKFGYIQIESAGEFRKIFIRQAFNPEQVKAVILEQQKNTKPY